ncbi:MAG: hypothetical protein PHV28_16405 [Kiritimatiellae bacterium]|nr:hypothetical protein [Kiritimatiellia bacterium]
MKKRQDGSAVLVVLGVISIVMIVCAMLGYSATQQMRATQITREMLKARLIAESGLNKAYNAVKDNFSRVRDYTESATFGDGVYTVRAVDLQDDGSVQRARLVSEGVCGIGRAVVSADIENRPKVIEGVDDDNYFSLTYDLISGGDLTLTGNFGAHVTTVFSNGAIDLKGSSDVEAMIIAGAKSISWHKMPANVTLVPNQPAQEIFPAALAAAVQSLIDHAVQNGAVYDDASDIPVSPPGGVAYCTGSGAGWRGGGTGCFIFEGDFSATYSHLTLTAANDYPALIVLSPSDVKFSAWTEIHGAVLLPNSSLQVTGHAELYGPLIVGQTIKGTGTADLYAGDGQGFSLPPDQEVTDNVVITAWH